MKTVERKGLQSMAKEAGLDLYSLPYTDARPQRLEWLAQQPVNPPMVSPLSNHGHLRDLLSSCKPWLPSCWQVTSRAAPTLCGPGIVAFARLPSTLRQGCSI